jgi:Na+(H+)/acetate symporter ActP
MDLQTWTYIIVGVTFALYMELQSSAGSTKEFYVAGGRFLLGKRNGQRRPTG